MPSIHLKKFNLQAPSLDADYVATVLVCDPQFVVSRALVRLQNGVLKAELMEHQRPIGNLHQDAVATLFSWVLLRATTPIGSKVSGVTSDAASFIFLEPSDDGLDAMIPLDLAKINENMNAYTQSAAKAFLSGNVSPTITAELRHPTYLPLCKMVLYRSNELLSRRVSHF